MLLTASSFSKVVETERSLTKDPVTYGVTYGVNSEILGGFLRRGNQALLRCCSQRFNRTVPLDPPWAIRAVYAFLFDLNT